MDHFQLIHSSARLNLLWIWQSKDGIITPCFWFEDPPCPKKEIIILNFQDFRGQELVEALLESKVSSSWQPPLIPIIENQSGQNHTTCLYFLAINAFSQALKWFQEDPSPGTQELPKKFFSPKIFQAHIGLQTDILKIYFWKKTFFQSSIQILKYPHEFTLKKLFKKMWSQIPLFSANFDFGAPLTLKIKKIRIQISVM